MKEWIQKRTDTVPNSGFNRYSIANMYAVCFTMLFLTENPNIAVDGWLSTGLDSEIELLSCFFAM